MTTNIELKTAAKGIIKAINSERKLELLPVLHDALSELDLSWFAAWQQAYAILPNRTLASAAETLLSGKQAQIDLWRISKRRELEQATERLTSAREEAVPGDVEMLSFIERTSTEVRMLSALLGVAS